MGRRFTVSSSSSAESNFRELDEVFLQNQTRIWLGEVLSTRLDEDLHISDLLQDGEILFEVSKVVWNLLLTKCMELKHLKLKYGPFSSKRCSGKYRPYSNVDSFIKICKILGMSGIDLFSPSDVVEKRDIRKVCICIRALSKKARSKQLNVPDFDVVMYSLAMPTEMVGGIRRSLESSQGTTSSNYNSYKDSQTRQKQKIVQATSDGVEDYSSEASDEAESRYMGENSFSSTSKFDEEDYEDVGSEVEESPYVSAVRDSSRINVEEKNYISDYLAFSDLMVHASEGSSSVVLDETNNMFDFFCNVDELASTKQSKLTDDEEMEVSSTTSMSSVVGRMLKLEFGEQIDTDESSIANDNSIGNETRRPHRDMYSLSKIKNTEMSESPLDTENEIEIMPRTSSISSKDFLLPCDLHNNFCGENREELDIDNYNYKEILSCDDKGNIIEDGIISSVPGNRNQNEREHDISNLGNISIVDANMGTYKTPSSGKSILKTVLKGTAIASVLFILLNIRKSSGTNGHQTEQHRGGIRMSKESKFSSNKQQKGSIGKGIYPAEKLKL